MTEKKDNLQQGVQERQCRKIVAIPKSTSKWFNVLYDNWFSTPNVTGVTTFDKEGGVVNTRLANETACDIVTRKCLSCIVTTRDVKEMFEILCLVQGKWHVSGLHHTWVFNKYGKQVNTSEFSLAHFPLVTSGRCCSARGLGRWLHMCLSHPTSGLLQASQLIFGLPLRGNDCLVSASESFSLFL